jgi:hypothetical protein
MWDLSIPGGNDHDFYIHGRFMLRASLGDVAFDGSYEQPWAKRLGEDRFEVCCIPFFVYGLALGDVVRADAETGYVIRSADQRSGNGVVRVAVTSCDDVAAVHLRLHDLLGKLEYLHEWFFAGLALLGDAVEVDRIFI